MDLIETLKPILNELMTDATVPKNVKVKVEKVRRILKEDSELSIRASKALNELEDIAEDANLEPYTRTQVWNVISTLEKVQ
jgi:uncharacterized protein (UPF0147 family)